MIRNLSPILLSIALAYTATGETITLSPSADTGLFEFAPDNNLGNTNALQIGTNGQGTYGRGLFKFDVAGNLPAGARVESAVISIGVTGSGAQGATTDHDLYRVQLSWDEGTGGSNQGAAANEGEATWDSRFHGQSQWTVPGGAVETDFAANPSATAGLGGSGMFSFPDTPELREDVQSWLDDPTSNFGWVLISQDEGSASSTRRIATREHPTLKPQLRIEFTPFRTTEISHSGDQAVVDWQGGTSPFTIEQATTLGGEWSTIGTTNAPPFEFAQPANRTFLRVREATASDTARYRLTWKATWSSATHPTNFPGGAHFSDLYGATHNESVSLWEPGGIATTGIKNMAERGSNSALRTEILAAVSAGTAENLVDGNFIQSPGETSVTFDVSQSHPLASFVCMIAPSPDWFVGVHGLPLFQNGAWLERTTVALQAYDAGTDSGTNYTSSNAPTNPFQPISQIDLRGETRPLGTFTFERIE